MIDVNKGQREMQNAMILNIRKKYKTRDGHKVNLLVLDCGEHKYPVKFEYLSNSGDWIECYCTKDGKYLYNGVENPFDLVEDTTMQIEIGKKYKTKDGGEVKLYEILPDQSYAVMGAIRERHTNSWIMAHWTIDGFYYGKNDEMPFDLVEVEVEEIDWSKVPVDTKLRLTSLSPRTSTKRYFAGVADKNKIKVFCDGATSWSAFGTINFDLTSWDVEIIND
jgi:hypothetical protein